MLGIASNDLCVCRVTGDKPEEDFMRDAGFRSFIQSLGSNLSTSSSAEGMTSTFSLTIKEEHCVGVKPERRAQEWADDWPEDEIAECFTIAMSLAILVHLGQWHDRWFPEHRSVRTLFSPLLMARLASPRLKTRLATYNSTSSMLGDFIRALAPTRTRALRHKLNFDASSMKTTRVLLRNGSLRRTVRDRAMV